MLEILEPRIAPATLLTGGKTVEFKDVDGDVVHLTITNGVFSQNSVTKDIPGLDFEGPANGNQRLLGVSLSDPQFAGTGLSVKVITTVGDGKVDVGGIFARGNDLGAVVIGGGLGKVVAGNNVTPRVGIASLTVDSLGALDPDDFDLIDRDSFVRGGIALFKTTGNVEGFLDVSGGVQAGLGVVDIGGSLVGGTDGRSGVIETSGAITTLIVRQNIDGSTADDLGEASVFSGRGIGSLTVTGSIIAGAEDQSGRVVSTLAMGPVRIGGSLGGAMGGEESGAVVSLRGGISSLTIGGSLVGGTGDRSGFVEAGANIGLVTIGGSITGGDGDSSGFLRSFGNLTSVLVTGSLTGGEGENSGAIRSEGNIGTVVIGNGANPGSITGGGGELSGTVTAAERINAVTVGLISGNLQGGSGDESGMIAADTLGTVLVRGTIQGATGEFSGSVRAEDVITTMTVLGNLTGSTGDSSGAISSQGTIGLLTLLGGVTGGDGEFSGSIQGLGGLGTVNIGQGLTGGEGDDSGSIQAGGQVEDGAGGQAITPGNITKVSIGGAVAGDDGIRSGAVIAWNGRLADFAAGQGVTGGTGTYSALIYGGYGIGKVSLGSHLQGGDGDYSGRVATDRGPIGTVVINGDIRGGAGELGGCIYSTSGLTSISVKNIVGGSSAATGFIYAETNAGVITINGNLEGSAHTNTGLVLVGGSVKTVSVSGSILGGDAVDENVNRSGAIVAGALGAVTVGQNLQAGTVVDDSYTLRDSGAIRSDSTIGSVRIGGSIVGNDTHSAQITGRVLFGPIAKNTVIGSVQVTGNVSYANILAGIDLNNNWVNPWAQIGAVTVGGTWQAGSVSAGGKPGPNGFGVGDTVSPNGLNSQPAGNFSRIGAVTIVGGLVDAPGTDPYGFVSKNFGTITIGGVPMTIPASGASTPLGSDTWVNRLPA
ncbi:MAG: hypothetical protein SFU53_13690 [Terrimicrobiaceae bacterium]|nr:hypothetical protein [Terrimicrobiaceae bacterium]